MTERQIGSGQPFRVNSREHSNWQAAGKLARENQFGTNEPPGVDDDNQDGIILVKNTTGRPLRRFSVLGLRGSLYNPNYNPPQSLIDFKNNIAIKGEVPSSVTTGRFCVLQRPAIENEWVEARVSGLTQCLLKVGSITDEFADIETDPGTAGAPIDQTTYLKTGSSGSAQIIHHPEVTGEQWGVVRLGNRASQWNVGTAATLIVSAPTLSSSPSTSDSGFVDFSAWDGTSTLEKEAGTGYLIVKRDVLPCFIHGTFSVSVPTVQNNWALVNVRLQMQNPDTLAWIGSSTAPQRTTMWPNVAVLSGGTAHFDNYTLDLRQGIALNKDWKIRTRVTVTYSGTLSDVTVECNSLNFFYQ